MTSTKKLTGRIGYVDLEGGYYTLITAQGEVYKLDGGGPDLRVPNACAQVEGTVDEAGFGIAFGTPVLHVKKYEMK